jgi:hypothetical protein
MLFCKKIEPIIFGRLEEMKIQFWTLKKLLEMIKWITFALILFVSCILGVLGEFLNILLTFWSGRKKSSRLFFDLFFTLYLSSPRSFGVILWRYVTHLSIVVFSINVQWKESKKHCFHEWGRKKLRVAKATSGFWSPHKQYTSIYK